MGFRETIHEWMDQFENDHYEFNVYGKTVKVNLARETMEKVLDISIILCDRVVEAQGELTTAEYEALEESVREQYPSDDAWTFFLVLKAFEDEKLFGRYKDIEPMIANLSSRDYPRGSAAYLLTVRPEIHMLIYAVIRHVDDIKENYESLAYTFFIGVLTKGWGEGLGWSKTKDGNWEWTSSDINKQ